ncbi:MAG: AAA family ATPase [Acidobacteriia bacterium]|nr:AAA family ATPase [Terriglobia bacterium]MYG01369.1 AAA family ATPase [Terriglobia bacterium]MYK10725.1 AAA family ATPase [Terriglobia bacterium]
MPDKRTNGPHLPDLSIRNFRGIQHLSIRRLGRVTLLGGRNGIGKTTILEAVRVYAARAHPRALDEILGQREETPRVFDEDHLGARYRDYTALFHGRAAAQEPTVEIGPISEPAELVMQLCPWEALADRQQELFAEISMVGDWQFLRVRFKGGEISFPAMPVERDPRAAELRRHYTRSRRHGLFEYEQWGTLNCESLGPGIADNSTLARFWDSVALTEEEDLSLQALRLASSDIERIAVVGDEGSGFRGHSRRIVAKVRGYADPVPLKSLGDGATRLFAAGLALANSRGGFLMIDEAENGIHHSLEHAFWRMVLRAAHEYNVQVLATTHSSDCVAGFARAAAEAEHIDGSYVRLDGEGDRLRAVEYTEEELQTVAEQAIEVR